ncbi:cobalamin-binding protein [Candidatus Bathyarchaeota archaeon]|nr:cobalamin-binding protein [Candidatus Bathyarchaeota archaeon]
MKKIKEAISLCLIAVMIMVFVMGFVEVAVSSQPVTVIDDLGRTVTIMSSERIVSIGPSCTEILCALGLADRIIAVDKYSDYPPEVIAKQKISKVMTPDPEEIIALNPDLVVYYHWGPWDPTVETLSNLGLTVIALHPKTIEDVIKDIRLLGTATGKTREAEALASTLSQRINEIKSKISQVIAKPKVYIESWYPPPWTFGPNTWGHQMIELAGGVNAFGDAAAEWVQTTDEEVIARNPDVIISLYGYMHYATLEDFKKRPGWDRIAAVTKGAVYLLDENLFHRPGPRIIEGLEALAKILHPDLFGGAKTFTFLVNETLLRTGIQSFKVTGVMDLDVLVVKAASSCILMVTLSRTGPEAPPNKLLVGSYIDVDCSVPEGLVYILRVYYSEEQLRALGVSEDSLKIYLWDEKGGKWVALNSALSKETNLVESTVMHLGYFALMGESAPQLPPWEQPIPLWIFVLSLVAVASLAFVGAYAAYRRVRGAR